VWIVAGDVAGLKVGSTFLVVQLEGRKAAPSGPYGLFLVSIKLGLEIVDFRRW